MMQREDLDDIVLDRVAAARFRAEVLQEAEEPRIDEVDQVGPVCARL